MPVALLGDLAVADHRLRRFGEEALAALGSGLAVPIRVVAGESDYNTAGWADSSGVTIVADQLAGSGHELRALVFEEIGHYWFSHEHGGNDDYEHECFAVWFACTHGGADWDPDEVDEASDYELGRLVGGMLADSADYQLFDQLEPDRRRAIRGLEIGLAGIDDPAHFARALTERRPVTAATPEKAAVLEALHELEDTWRWVHRNVYGFGGRGRRVTDELLDEAIARVHAAGERLEAAVAALAAKQRGS
jgi:hypothetical protein